MINEELESDLQAYAKTQDATLFNDKLYSPLTNLFKWLCKRQARQMDNADFQDIQQRAMLRIVKYFKHFKPSRGRNAISYARMLMKQELVLGCKAIYKQNNRTIQYSDNIESNHIFVSEKTINEYSDLLKQYQTTAPVEHKKIICVIINLLQSKEILSLSYKDKLKHISTKARCSFYLVKKVLKEIKAQKFYLS